MMRIALKTSLLFVLLTVLVPSAFGQALLRNQDRGEQKKATSLLVEDSNILVEDDPKTPAIESNDQVNIFADLCNQALALIESDRERYEEILDSPEIDTNYMRSLFNDSMASGEVLNLPQALAIALHSPVFLKPAGKSSKNWKAIYDLRKTIPDQESEMSYAIFAEGQVLKQHQGSDEVDPDTRTSGSLGIQGATTKKGFALRMAIAANETTIDSDHAYTILPRSGGKSLNSGGIDFLIHDALDEANLHLYGSASSLKWATTDANDNIVVSDVVIAGAGVLANWTLADKKVGNTILLATCEIGYSWRFLWGADMDDRATRKSYLQTSDSSTFHGFEMGMQLQLGDIVGAFQYYHYIGDSVSGLTRGSVVAGFGINADLFSDL